MDNGKEVARLLNECDGQWRNRLAERETVWRNRLRKSNQFTLIVFAVMGFAFGVMTLICVFNGR